jgi:hypothetical protein
MFSKNVGKASHWIAVRLIVLLFGIVLVSGHSVGQDVQFYPLLSVGAFQDYGHQQGLAGGARFSGTTFSINALTGEAPIGVSTDDGREAFAVRPNGDVVVDNNLIVYGEKRFANPDPKDPNKVISYISLEGGEAGVYTRGTAQLINGEAVVNLPEHFTHIASEEGITVGLTPLGKWLQLYVSEKSSNRITVREANNVNGRFDYIVQGIRKGHENYQPVSYKQ